MIKIEKSTLKKLRDWRCPDCKGKIDVKGEVVSKVRLDKDNERVETRHACLGCGLRFVTIVAEVITSLANSLKMNDEAKKKKKK